MEEDSFKGRVDKIFGSLSSSSSSFQTQSPSLWSLTDDEIERRQWNRRKDNPDRDDQTPCSSSFQGLFFKDRNLTPKKSRNKLDDPSDDEEEEDDEDDQLGDNNDDEELNIRSSIGLDCTLDNEEEEDAYDKMAEGRENVGDRVYMKDVTDHGPFLNSHNVLLPTSVDESTEDFPSNNYAANIKLKEDETDPTIIEKGGSNPIRDESLLKAQEPRLIEREDGTKVKPILKRKSDTAVKSSKRVKFNTVDQEEYVEPSEEHEETFAGPSTAVTKGQDEDSTHVKRKVPDYILNPSKYTRYSFDSSDINEESNIRACMDLLGNVKRSNATALENKSEDISAGKKSVVFIPRKKATDCKEIDGSTNMKSNQSMTQASPAVGVTAVKVQVDEVSAMEEDTAAACTNVTFQKAGRRYRIKSGVEESSP